MGHRLRLLDTDRIVTALALLAFLEMMPPALQGGESPPAPPGMVLIPAGKFVMGNCMDPAEGELNELPLHTVYVSALYMDRYEVTKALWDEVYGWAITHGYGFDNAGSGKGANHPVQTVNWFDVVKWTNARSQREGLTPCYTVAGVVYKSGQSAPECNWSANGYRLPTEAEWEKAARGGASGHRFPWTDSDLLDHSRANYYSFWMNGKPWRAPWDKGYEGYDTRYATGVLPYTSPVGSFAPNGYGLYDLSGNVLEWCWDWHGPDYYRSSPASDPRGPASGLNRVIRDGCWVPRIGGSRISFRDWFYPYQLDNGTGFRCARRQANIPPLATPQGLTTAEDTAKAIVLTATDADGDALTYGVVSVPAHGILSGTAPGLTYTPAANYSGPDSFTFKVNDGKADSNVATVSISVTLVNDLPTLISYPSASPNPARTGQAVTFSAAASDVDGDLLTYGWNFGDGTTGTGAAPSHAFAAPGSYLAAVTVSDGQGGSASGVVVVTVTQVDTAGPALNVGSAVLKGTASDVSGVAALKVNGAAVTVNADGTWQKEVPLSGATTAVTLSATDKVGNTTNQTVTISK